MPFLRNHRGPITAMILTLIGLEVSSFCQMEPYNVTEGLIVPIEVRSNVVATGTLLRIHISSIPSGAFTFQQSDPGESPLTWTDISLTQNLAGEFTLEALSGSLIYRLKHDGSQEINLTASASNIDHSMIRILDFPLLPEWNYSLQSREMSGDQWTTIEGFTVSNSPVLVPATLSTSEVRVLAKPPIEREDYEAIFVGGQSNASLSDNWYYPVKETNVIYIDGEIRFRNPAKFYEQLKTNAWGYSFAVGGTIALSEITHQKYLLVSVAIGGTSMLQWMPGSNRFNQSTLFGRANFRRVATAPQGVRAIWYYGHESSTGTPELYIEQWKKLMAEFQKEMGPVPIIFAQLAKSTDPSMHSHNFSGAEQQRLSEAGENFGTPGHHMVVTFDLPLADGLHLSGEAQRLLGFRFARAMRQHVYGEAIDGTGPRLSGITHPNGDRKFVQITFTQAINEPLNNYDNQFMVSDSNGVMPIAEVSRTNRGQSVLIELEREPVGTVKLSYGAPKAEADLVYLTNVVRNAEGLPAPVFGPQEVL